MYSSYDRALLTIFAPQPSAFAKKKKKTSALEIKTTPDRSLDSTHLRPW